MYWCCIYSCVIYNLEAHNFITPLFINSYWVTYSSGIICRLSLKVIIRSKVRCPVGAYCNWLKRHDCYLCRGGLRMRSVTTPNHPQGYRNDVGD